MHAILLAASTPPYFHIQLSDEQMSSPAMTFIFQMIALGVLLLVLAYALASRIAAGPNGGFFRGVGTFLAAIPSYIVAVIAWLAFAFVSPLAATVFAILLFVGLLVWSAAAIHGISSWRGALVHALGIVIAMVLSWVAEAFLVTPEKKELVAKFAEDIQKSSATAQQKNAEPSPAASDKTTETVMASQRAAMSRYPELAFAGSRMNTMFLARVKQARTSRPALFQKDDWPLKIADEVAAEFGIAPK